MYRDWLKASIIESCKCDRCHGVASLKVTALSLFSVRSCQRCYADCLTTLDEADRLYDEAVALGCGTELALKVFDSYLNGAHTALDVKHELSPITVGQN